MEIFLCCFQCLCHSWVAYLFTTEPNIGWVGGFASLSGLLLCIILSVIVVCSMRWIRRGFILGILLVAFIVFAFLYIAYYSCYELL
ncbi:unnamed protein product, partial [Rotaria magnacalcarata]